ncbi:MAG TPA: GntR family transcriptional regulator [Chloroflexota bacterium]|nr:GntR family transcriptional regulator [Chloroflexota bacterium]
MSADSRSGDVVETGRWQDATLAGFHQAALSLGDGRAPLYHQLKELLRDLIESGQWARGERIPPERELCATFNVSRATTTQALNDLERMGLVERRQGKGTFVARPKLVQDLLDFRTLTRGTLASDLTPTMKILSMEVVDPVPRLAQLLEVSMGEKLIRIERLRMVNDEPMMMDVCSLPYAMCPDLLHDNLEENLLYDLLSQKYGIKMVEQEKWVEPVMLDDFEAGLLRTKKGALGLLVERVAYCEGRRPMEFRKMLVPGHRCKYVVEVSRP